MKSILKTGAHLLSVIKGQVDKSSVETKLIFYKILIQ